MIHDTLADRSSRLRKIVLGWARSCSLPIRRAISRYKDPGISVSCRSKSTFRPTIEDRASRHHGRLFVSQFDHGQLSRQAVIAL